MAIHRDIETTRTELAKPDVTNLRQHPFFSTSESSNGTNGTDSSETSNCIPNGPSSTNPNQSKY